MIFFDLLLNTRKKYAVEISAKLIRDIVAAALVEKSLRPAASDKSPKHVLVAAIPNVIAMFMFRMTFPSA